MDMSQRADVTPTTCDERYPGREEVYLTSLICAGTLKNILQEEVDVLRGLK